MRFLKHLYVQVLIGLALGILVGFLFPSIAVSLKPLGDVFIKLIKAFVTILVFCTVTIGIAKMESLKDLGKIGIKTMVYFQVMTLLALVIGFVVAHVIQPGAGMHIDPSSLDASSISNMTAKVNDNAGFSLIDLVIPHTVVDAFASGNLLQVLFFSVVFGVTLSTLSQKSQLVVQFIDQSSTIFMKIIDYIMYLAPFAAFGAMAFTVGKYGAESLGHLAMLILCFYVTSILFVFIVLNAVCWYVNVSLVKLLRYFKDELLIVLGTSTTESVLPKLMDKLERVGCHKSIVGLVLPTGYSFNLDGAAIYLTMTTLFIAQAMDIQMTWGQQLGLLLIMIVTSKGGAGVAGAALVVLTATLASQSLIPVAGVTLVLGIDRIQNEVRALVNMIGNVVATLCIAKWENLLDMEQLNREINKRDKAKPVRIKIT